MGTQMIGIGYLLEQTEFVDKLINRLNGSPNLDIDMLLTTLVSFLKYVRAEEKFSEKLRTQIRRLSISEMGFHEHILEDCVKALEVDRWLRSDEKEVTREHRQAVFMFLKRNFDRV